jgi:hypothetical protein
MARTVHPATNVIDLGMVELQVGSSVIAVQTFEIYVVEKNCQRSLVGHFHNADAPPNVSKFLHLVPSATASLSSTLTLQSSPGWLAWVIHWKLCSHRYHYGAPHFKVKLSDRALYSLAGKMQSLTHPRAILQKRSKTKKYSCCTVGIIKSLLVYSSRPDPFVSSDVENFWQLVSGFFSILNHPSNCATN